MLDIEFQYFLDYQNEIVSKFNGRYVVIVGQEVKGDFPTELEAYYFAVDKYEKGKFLIQHAIPGEKAYTKTFHTRVGFD